MIKREIKRKSLSKLIVTFSGDEHEINQVAVGVRAMFGHGNERGEKLSYCVLQSTASDIPPPATPTVTSLTTISTTPTISGTANLIAGDVLTVAVNNVTYSVGADLTLSGNQWTLVIPAVNALAEGTYDVLARITNSVGDFADDTTLNELTVDLAAPNPAPTVETLSTDDTTPIIVGTATVGGGDSFSVIVNGVEYPESGSDLTLTGTDWSLQIPSGNELAVGQYDVQAVVTDGAQNDVVDQTTGELTIVDPPTPPTPGQYASLDDFVVNPSFDRDTNLPTPFMRSLYDKFWASWDVPRTYNGVTYTGHAANGWDKPPELYLLNPVPLTGNSRGSYHMARTAALHLQAAIMGLRCTGAPRFMDEIKWFSTRYKDHIQDWDGRGYEFARYRSSDNTWHWETDTNWLDECMLIGTLGALAFVMHQNRATDPVCDADSQYWLDYLDQVHIPKWIYRTHNSNQEDGSPIFPAARVTALGLGNALDWPSNERGSSGDFKFNNMYQPYFGNDFRVATPIPVREYAHAAILNLLGFALIGRMLNERGQTAQGNWTQTNQEYLDHADRVEAWWIKQCTDRADGSRDFWLNMNGTNSSNDTPQYRKPQQTPGGESGLRNHSYAPHVWFSMSFLNMIQFGHWANDSEMLKYTKCMINSTGDGAYIIGNNNNMHFSTAGEHGGGGTKGKAIRSVAYMMYWDDTPDEFIKTETDRVAINRDPDSHIMSNSGTGTNSNRNDMNHMTGYMYKVMRDFYEANPGT